MTAYKGGRFELYSRINVGIAVAAQDALVVPPGLSGGTFSVSNLGMYGVSSFEAIVNTPQAGILAVGAIADEPVVKDGEVVPGKLMDITRSCDHRILYGADGAEFLAEVKRLLQEPIGLGPLISDATLGAISRGRCPGRASSDHLVRRRAPAPPG